MPSASGGPVKPHLPTTFPVSRDTRTKPWIHGSIALEPSSSASQAGETSALSQGGICSMYARASSRVCGTRCRLFVGMRSVEGVALIAAGALGRLPSESDDVPFAVFFSDQKPLSAFAKLVRVAEPEKLFRKQAVASDVDLLTRLD